MCPQGPTRLPLTGALALVLAAAVLTAPTFARAEDDNVPIDTKILRGIMEGIGLKRAGEAPIKYQERPPLVIPPSTDLPPPQQPGAAIANNPAWPKDSDVARAKLLREREKNRDVTAEAERDSNPLPPDQLAPGAARQRTASRGTNAPDNPSGNKNGDDIFRLTPSELGYHGGLFGNLFNNKDDSATAQFTGEPKRTSLTEPPPGYQTPSPNQPYGLGKSNTKPKPENYYLTHVETHN